ncbi:hypothetical protein ACHAXR_008463 [Thalassiosira sp. AJA248-18]
MMNALSALSLLLAALTTPSVSAINFDVNTAGAGCDGDPFDNADIDVSCNNGGDCGFGDTAVVDGTIEAVSTFSPDSEVTLKACIWSVYCPADATRDAGTLCGNWLTPTENQTCGEMGMYDVTREEVIPEASIPPSWLWLVTVTIGVSADECDVGGSYGMAYSMAGLASLAIVGAAYAARKRRGDNDDEKLSRFIEMTDSAVV